MKKTVEREGNPRKGKSWIIAAFSILAIRIFATWFPDATESVYSNGLFAIVRYILDYTFGLLPFPGILLLLIVAIYGLIRRRRKIKCMGGLSSGRKKPRLLYRFLVAISMIWIFYTLSWGFNYLRPSFIMKNGLAEFVPDTIFVKSEARAVMAMMEQVRGEISPGGKEDTISVSHDILPADLNSVLDREVKRTLIAKNYSPAGDVKIRTIWPDGLLLRFGISGIYFPFTGEGHVDGSLTACDLPFTMAHEIAHGYGIADESEANAIAWFALAESEYPVFQYAAYLNHYRFLAAGWMQLDSLEFKVFADSIAPGIRADLLAIRSNRIRYRPWFPEISESVNDFFLRIQGIEQGIRSYGKFVLILKAWQEKNMAGQSYLYKCTLPASSAPFFDLSSSSEISFWK